MSKNTIILAAVAALVFTLAPAAHAQFSTGFEAPDYFGQAESAGAPGGASQLIPQNGWIMQPNWDSNHFDVHTYEGAQIPWTPQKIEPGPQLYPVAPRPMPVNLTGGEQFIALGTSDDSAGGRNLLEVGYTPGLVEVSADFCAGFDGDYNPRQGQLRYAGTTHSHDDGFEIYASDASTDEFKWAFNVTARDIDGAVLSNWEDNHYRFDNVEGFDNLTREKWYRIGGVVDLDPDSPTYRRILQFKSQDLDEGGQIWIMDNPQALVDEGGPEPVAKDMYIGGGEAGTTLPTHLGFYNVGNGSLSMFDNAYVGAPYEWKVVTTGPPELVWRDATEDDWTSQNWTPDEEATWIAPAGAEVMIVNSGIATVSTDTTVLAPAVSLLVARDAPGGTVVIAPGGTLSVGDVDVAAGGRLNVNGSLLAGGLNVAAGGTMALGNGATIVSPLAAPDLSDVTMTVNGALEAGDGVGTVGDEDNDLSSTNLTLGDGATFEWTFGAGADNYVDVNGEVTLAGGLTIQLVEGGGGANGADVALFRALDANIVDISSVIVLSPVGQSWTWSTDGGGNPMLTFGGEFLVLEGLVTGVAGDTNGDGIVNDADLANFEAQFGGSPGADSADFDGDGDVDAHDFATMRGNWGFGVGPAPLSGDATPEPATMCMLMFGGLGILLRRRSHKA